MAAIDISVIESYRKLLGDETDPFIVKLIGTYLDNSLKLVANIENSFDTNDFNAMVLAAHTLKSSSAIVGATILTHLALAIEQSGREGHTTELQDTVSRLTVEYGHVRQALEDLQRTMSR
jgi:HPt (histidine-containing phosphotransfer) domain-containing protein